VVVVVVVNGVKFTVVVVVSDDVGVVDVLEVDVDSVVVSSVLTHMVPVP
jgi:hypothetical protein